MKKILITGNSGYIGSHLSKLLMDSGKYEVHGIDLVHPQCQIHRSHHWDINLLNPIYFDGENLETDLAGEEFDAVVHLAALVNVGDSMHEPLRYYNTNISGTLKVLDNVKTKNFILASTGAAEGCASPYGVSKRAAEDCTRQWCQDMNTPFTIFRFYNVIGSNGFEPTNPDGLMYNLMKAKDTGQFTIFGTDYAVSPDGTCVRDYVHVMEICDAIQTAIENPSGKIECLGHGVGYTVKEMVEIFQRVNDVDFDVRYGPRRSGDLPSSVLEEVSPYMRNLYTIDDLLRLS